MRCTGPVSPAKAPEIHDESNCASARACRDMSCEAQRSSRGLVQSKAELACAWKTSWPASSSARSCDWRGPSWTSSQILPSSRSRGASAWRVLERQPESIQTLRRRTRKCPRLSVESRVDYRLDSRIRGEGVAISSPPQPPRNQQSVTRDTTMIVVTTPTLEGSIIRQYLGVVTGEAILVANIFRDFFAGIRDIVGGRGPPTRRTPLGAGLLWPKCRKIRCARRECCHRVDIATRTSAWAGGGFSLVSASGTAVLID